MKKSPILPTDDAARATGRNLMAGARHAALGVLDPANSTPFVSRIAFTLAADGQPISLISTLAFHTRALQANPACSLLIGEPPAKGDPLAFARLTLSATASFIPQADRNTLSEGYLKTHPKAALYINFSDFHFVRFTLIRGALNGGFGRAYALTASDMA